MFTLRVNICRPSGVTSVSPGVVFPAQPLEERGIHDVSHEGFFGVNGLVSVRSDWTIGDNELITLLCNRQFKLPPFLVTSFYDSF